MSRPRSAIRLCSHDAAPLPRRTARQPAGLGPSRPCPDQLRSRGAGERQDIPGLNRRRRLVDPAHLAIPLDPPPGLLDRVRLRQQQEVAFASALDLVRRSNPMRSPSGQRAVGDLMVAWTSKPVEPPKVNVDQSGMPGNHTVGLYTVHVQVTRAGRPIGRFYVRQMGWKQNGRDRL